MQIDNIYDAKKNRELSEREQDILRSIVNLYILKATPIGSRNLSKYLEEKINLSPATLRNVMSDLEEMDFIGHPHTSAGRVPTDKGYRFYVDSLKNIDKLAANEMQDMRQTLTAFTKETDTLLKETNRMLGAISNYLSVIRIPHLVDLVVEKIQLINISSNRILVVIALDSNVVRTVTLEVDYELEQKQTDIISTFINERVAGKSLRFLRENFSEIINDFEYTNTPLIRLFVDSVDKIFETKSDGDKIITSGTQNLLSYPEFGDTSGIKSIIELIENEDIIIHLLDNLEESESGIKVLIGSEMQSEILENYSIVLSSYKMGGATGTIGLIGPKRMNYPRLMSIVQNASKIIMGE